MIASQLDQMIRHPIQLARKAAMDPGLALLDLREVEIGQPRLQRPLEQIAESRLSLVPRKTRYAPLSSEAAKPVKAGS